MTRETDDTNGELAKLTDAVELLRQEVQVLRQVLDEIRTDLSWAVSNDEFAHEVRLPWRRISSMPLDPTAPDFAARINAIRPEDVPQEDDHTQPKVETLPPGKDQRNLF